MHKNIIVTGASRGIGKEIAKQHLALGNRVLTISRNLEKLDELNHFAQPNQLINIGLDLSKYKDIDQILAYIKDWETVDILYNLSLIHI